MQRDTIGINATFEYKNLQKLASYFGTSFSFWGQLRSITGNDTPGKTVSIFLQLFLLIDLCLLGLAGFGFYRGALLEKTGIRVTGTVVDKYSIEHGGSRQNYTDTKITFEFKNTEGNSVVGSANVSSGTDAPVTGEKIEIIYKKGKEDFAVPVTDIWDGFYFGIAFFCVSALVTSVLAGLYFLLTLKSRVAKRG